MRPLWNFSPASRSTLVLALHTCAWQSRLTRYLQKQFLRHNHAKLKPWPTPLHTSPSFSHSLYCCRVGRYTTPVGLQLANGRNHRSTLGKHILYISRLHTRSSPPVPYRRWISSLLGHAWHFIATSRGRKNITFACLPWYPTITTSLNIILSSDASFLCCFSAATDSRRLPARGQARHRHRGLCSQTRDVYAALCRAQLRNIPPESRVVCLPGVGVTDSLVHRRQEGVYSLFVLARKRQARPSSIQLGTFQPNAQQRFAQIKTAYGKKLTHNIQQKKKVPPLLSRASVCLFEPIRSFHALPNKNPIKMTTDKAKGGPW